MLESSLSKRHRNSIKSSLDLYNYHDSKSFLEALMDFSLNCEIQLPKVNQIFFKPRCFDISNDEEHLIIGGEEGNIANFEIKTEKILRDEEICYRVSIINIFFAMQDTQLVLLNELGEIYVLEYPSFEVIEKIEFQTFILSISLDINSQSLYINTGKSEILIVEIASIYNFYENSADIKKIRVNDNISCICLDQSSFFIGIGMENGVVSVLNQINNKSINYQNSAKPTLVVFNPSGTQIAGAFEDFSIRVWKIESELILCQTFVKHSDRVTGISFVSRDMHLFSCSLDSFIYLWDLKIENLPYCMNVQNTGILGIKGSKDNKKVFYFQETPEIMIWKLPFLPKSAIYRGHTGKINKILFAPDNYDLISIGQDGLLQTWDYNNDSPQESLKMQHVLTDMILYKSGHRIIILTPEAILYNVNRLNNNIETIDIRFNGIFIEVSANQRFVAIGDQQSRVHIYELEHNYRKTTLKGHGDIIVASCFILDDKFLITASRDCTLGKWDIDSETRVGTFVGHETGIVNMKVVQDKWIISSSEEGNILIWNFEGIVLYKIYSEDRARNYGMYVSNDNTYLVILEAYKCLYWQLDNLSVMFQLDFESQCSSFAVSNDENFIAVVQENSIYMFENPMKSRYTRVVGKSLGTPHKFMKFVIDCQKESPKVPYDMNYNHWVVVPYLFGPAHILAFCNRSDDLNKAFFHSTNRTSLFSSIYNENPLSICVDMEYKNCIDVCLRYMKTESQDKGRPKNIRAYVPLESCLTKLNTIEYPYISKLYDSMFKEIYDSYLPRFCLLESNLPSLYLSDHLVIYPDELVSKNFFNNTGRPIMFFSSTFPLDIDIGTNGSIEFIKSLLECSDKEIFRSAIVKEYLQFKWKRIKPAIYVQGFTYVLYLVLLGFYIVSFTQSGGFLGLLVTVHILLWSFEVLQIATDFTEYWFSVWNVLDQLRSLSFSYYTIMAYDGDYNHDVLLAVLIFSWSRGIACFRMFEETRYMVRLILQVIIDITTFFLILFYATLAFTFIFFLRNPKNMAFPMYLTVAYRLDLGDLDSKYTEVFDWVLFFVATMINPLIMLNLLIAIMSDTATLVAEIDDICGLEELAEMILDIEKTMFWKRSLTHKHYLHKCDFVKVEDSETNKTLTKIKTIKKQVCQMNTTINSIKKSAEKISKIQIKETLDEILTNQNEIKASIKSYLDKNSTVIGVINKQVKRIEVSNFHS